MKNLKRQFKTIMIATVALAMVTFIGCSTKDDPITPPGPTKDIVQIAKETPILSTLVTAIETAGLAPTLGGDVHSQYLHQPMQHSINWKKVFCRYYWTIQQFWPRFYNTMF
jgi:hypothetical protein